LGSFWVITKLAHVFGPLIPTVKDMHSFLQKMDWATFWANFSQTYLITQVVKQGCRVERVRFTDSTRVSCAFLLKKLWVRFKILQNKI
jgi:hypothetical protein